MSFLLVAIGIALLLACLAGIALGLYMSTEHNTRGAGRLFAAWWISGAAGASGVIMRDGVTFLIGLFCFLIAGAAFFLAGGVRRAPTERTRPGPPPPEGSEKTTRENRSGYRRAAS